LHSFICGNRVEVFLQTPILHREPADDFSCAGQVERDGNGVLPGCEPTERIGKVTLRDEARTERSVVSNLLQIVASVSPLKAMNAASSVASPAFAKMFAKGDPHCADLEHIQRVPSTPLLRNISLFTSVPINERFEHLAFV